jgi:hypothetical protein
MKGQGGAAAECLLWPDGDQKAVCVDTGAAGVYF